MVSVLKTFAHKGCKITAHIKICIFSIFGSQGYTTRISRLLAGFCWYWCYYPHRSRDALSPVSGIFFLKLVSVKAIMKHVIGGNSFTPVTGGNCLKMWLVGTASHLWLVGTSSKCDWCQKLHTCEWWKLPQMWFVGTASHLWLVRTASHVFAGPLSPGEALIVQYLSKYWRWCFESLKK